MSEPRLIRVPDWFDAPSTRFPDLSAVLRNPSQTVEEAEEYARSLGVVHADYREHLEIGNMVNEVLTELYGRHLSLFPHIFIRSTFFDEYGEDRYDTVAKTENRVVKINPKAKVFADIVATARNLYNADFWSTPHPLHAIYHEAGHLLLHHHKKPKTLLPRQVTVASAVSRYAQTNQEEFVSEVFAGLMCGVGYDKDILGLYSRLGGKKP